MSDVSDNLAELSGSGERPLVDSAWAQFEALAGQRRPEAAGDRQAIAIPGYRVLREMHRGGQGVVYQATQESTLRKVAIKVLKGGPLADPTERARFDREVDVLSRLKHRHIVAIHDRGLTSGGHAYYVMDYIPGRPLDAHVAGAALTTRDVLKLFHTICEAVNVAHLHGVIHRDLKPSNIRVDEENEPHILDFGLAKLAYDPASSAGVMTITGQFVGSLPWASPEQAEGRSDLLDVRTDVYSLGVILYQLLTRSFPYPVSGRMNEVVQHIIHTSPARPTSLARTMERDVEIILLKCLAKDSERRYQGAGELARDVQRFLNGEPIEARPATSIYQLRQFARRNRVLVTAVIAVIVTLVAATAVSVAFGLSEGRQRRAAEADRARAEKAEFQAQMRADELEQVAKFQEAQLSGIDVQIMGLRLRADLLQNVRTAAERLKLAPEALDARIAELEMHLAGTDFTGLALGSLEENFFRPALEAIDKQFEDQPLVRARLLQASADTLLALGLYEEAGVPQQEALAIRRRVLGANHPHAIAAVDSMGFVLLEQGKLAEAEVYLREAMEAGLRVLGDENPTTLSSMNNLGRVLQAQGKLDEAERYYRETLKKRRRALGDEHPETLGSINNMGFLLQAQGKLMEAEPYLREALEKLRRVLGADDPNTLIAINNMGALLYAQGRLSEAETYFHEAIDLSRQVLGEEHHDTLRAMDNMSVVLRAQGRPSDAEVYCRDSLEKHRRALGDEHPDTVISIGNMGVLLQAQGKLSEAEPYLNEALRTSRRVLGDGHPDTLRAFLNLGRLLQSDGRLVEAEQHFREALEGQRRGLGDEHPDTLIAIISMGALRRAQGNPAETVALLTPAEAAARRAFTKGNAPRLGQFLSVLGRARSATGDFEAAEANLNEAHTILNEAKGRTRQDHTDVLNGLVELYNAWHATAPDKGFDVKAAKWQAELILWQEPDRLQHP